MDVAKVCEQCGCNFVVPHWRGTKARFCGKTCSAEVRKAATNTSCGHCGKAIRVKASELRRRTGALGNHCSYACSAESRKTKYTGEKNPNWRGKTHDTDGYRVYVPAASHILGSRRAKLHHAVCCEALAIERIPRGLHVHHRDCDVENNSVENLVLMTASDHKWIHKQYGVATLWAVHHGKIDIDVVVEWADDKRRADRLLRASVSRQAEQYEGVLRELSLPELLRSQLCHDASLDELTRLGMELRI